MMRPDESRGSGTDMDIKSMNTRVQALSQQPSFSSVTTSTQVQSQDPRFYELFQQTQSLPSHFMKDHQQQQEKQSRECQPFYNFMAAEAVKFSDVQYNNFQTYILNSLQKYKRVPESSYTSDSSSEIHSTYTVSSSYLRLAGGRCSTPGVQRDPGEWSGHNNSDWK